MTLRKVLVVLLLDTILSVIVYPFLGIFLCPVFIYRLIVTILVKMIYPEYIPCSLLDQTVQGDYFRKSSDAMIFSSGAMVTVNGPVSISKLQNRWRRQFLEAKNPHGQLLYPKLSVTLVRIGGYNFLKPLKSIEAKDIFHEEKLNPQDLDKFKTDFLCRPYPRDGPLWEVVMVSMGQETKMFYRFHHVIADGYTQLYLLNQSMKRNAAQKSKPQRDEEYTFWEFIRAGLSFPRVLSVYAAETFKSRNSVPLSAKASDDIRISSTNIYFSDLKTVYRKTGANFLSINLSLYAQVLRRILKGKCYGDFVSVQTALPWPNHPANEGKMGNHFAVGILKIPMTDMSTLERIRQIDKTLKAFYKRRVDKILWWYWIPMLCIFPAQIIGLSLGWIQRCLGLKLMSSTLLSFENFEYEADGSPVIAVKPLLARCSYETVLIASTVIYNERCEVTFVGTPAVAKSQEEMDRIVHECYLEELDKMLEEIAENDHV